MKRHLLHFWLPVEMLRWQIGSHETMPLNLVSPSVPRTISGLVSVRQSKLPRYWATICSDVLNASLKPSTRRKHLTALDRLYEAVRRQRSSDCLDDLLAAADADALEECLVGFLAQLRNIDILRSAGSSPGAKADKIEAKILEPVPKGLSSWRGRDSELDVEAYSERPDVDASYPPPA